MKTTYSTPEDAAVMRRLYKIAKRSRIKRNVIIGQGSAVGQGATAQGRGEFRIGTTNYDALIERLASHAAAKPPKAAEAVLFFIAPKHQREAFLGDLEEDFQECTRKFGRSTAYLYCWYSVIRSGTVCFGPVIIKIIKELWG